MRTAREQKAKDELMVILNEAREEVLQEVNSGIPALQRSVDDLRELLRFLAMAAESLATYKGHYKHHAEHIARLCSRCRELVRVEDDLEYDNE